MSIEAAAALTKLAGASQSEAVSSQLSSTIAPSSQPFGTLMDALQNLNGQMAVNQQDLAALATGQSDELHRVIMNMESAKLSFDLALQVRNKVLDAYQELMRMQI